METIKNKSKVIKSFTSERNRKLVRMVTINNMTYSEVGRIFGISKQRVEQIIRKLVANYSKFGLEKNKYTKMVSDIREDIDYGLSYVEIIDKYNLDGVMITRLKYHGLDSLYSQCIDIRDNIICDLYSDGFTANEIGAIFDISFNNIYRIVTKHGRKRYPMIENRSGGGSYLSKATLKFIIDSREKGVQYKDIASMLNDMGERTTTGLEFNVFRVFAYYTQYKGKL